MNIDLHTYNHSTLFMPRLKSFYIILQMAQSSYLLDASFTWAAFKLQIDNYANHYYLTNDQIIFLYTCYKDPYWLYLNFPFAMVLSKAMSKLISPILLPPYIQSVIGPLAWPMGFKAWRREILDFHLVDYPPDYPDPSFDFSDWESEQFGWY